MAPSEDTTLYYERTDTFTEGGSTTSYSLGRTLFNSRGKMVGYLVDFLQETRSVRLHRGSIPREGEISGPVLIISPQGRVTVRDASGNQDELIAIAREVRDEIVKRRP